MIKTLDWYILKKFLGTFFYAILIMAVISCVIDYSQKVDGLIKHAAPASAIFNYFKNFVPYIVALLFPLFVFIAAVFFTSKLAYKTEIIAILATGNSFQRFLRPYVYGGIILGLLSVAINHFIVPAANKQRLDFEDRYIHDAVISSHQNVHMRLSPNLYVYMQRYDYSSNMGYRFTAERVKGILLTEKLMADRVSYDSVKKMWKLYDVTIRTNNGLKENLRKVPEMTQKYRFTPQELDEDNEIMTSLTTPQLLQSIKTQATRGAENLNGYYVELHRRTSEPFACFILTIIAACLASRKIRGGSGFHLAIGVALSVIYVFAMKTTTTYSLKAGLSPLIAVWIPNFIFGGVAYYLFRRQIK